MRSPFRLLVLSVTTFFLVVLAAIGALGWWWSDTKMPPDQPVAFSHMKHAGELGIACTHCHRYAGRGPEATVPALSVCMECHVKVKTDSPEIQKLTAAWADGRPIEWKRVHSLPWHARFTHKPHIGAGIECTTCHGEVAGMAVMRQARSLEMGWCLNCHRQKSAPTDCLTCHK